MWKDKVEQIRKRRQTRHKDLNAGASTIEIKNLQEKALNDLEKQIPEDYINVIKYINGLEYNGFILYGIDEELLITSPKQHINGLVANNLDWYENEDQKDYLFLGDSDISWYVYVPNSNCYLELDKPSGSIIEEYESFADLLNTFLDAALM